MASYGQEGCDSEQAGLAERKSKRGHLSEKAWRPCVEWLTATVRRRVNGMREARVSSRFEEDEGLAEGP